MMAGRRIEDRVLLSRLPDRRCEGSRDDDGRNQHNIEHRVG